MPKGFILEYQAEHFINLWNKLDNRGSLVSWTPSDTAQDLSIPPGMKGIKKGHEECNSHNKYIYDRDSIYGANLG